MFIEGSAQTSGVDKIEALRLILENEQHKSITYGEALEVGESLLHFFEILANDAELASQDLVA